MRMDNHLAPYSDDLMKCSTDGYKSFALLLVFKLGPAKITEVECWGSLSQDLRTMPSSQPVDDSRLLLTVYWSHALPFAMPWNIWGTAEWHMDISYSVSIGVRKTRERILFSALERCYRIVLPWKSTILSAISSTNAATVEIRVKLDPFNHPKRFHILAIDSFNLYFSSSMHCIRRTSVTVIPV
jgi:hypothetical protein